MWPEGEGGQWRPWGSGVTLASFLRGVLGTGILELLPWVKGRTPQSTVCPQMDEGRKEAKGVLTALSTATKWVKKKKKQVSELFHFQNSRWDIVDLYSILASISPSDAVLLFPSLVAGSSQLLSMRGEPFPLYLGCGVVDTALESSVLWRLFRTSLQSQLSRHRFWRYLLTNSEVLK